MMTEVTFNGVPCKKCGGTLRYINSGQRCVNCLGIYKQNNKDNRKAVNATYYQTNRLKIRQKVAKRREDNLELVKVEQARSYELHKSARLASVAAYSKANPEKMRASWARRRAAAIKRTPAWADLSAIETVYAERLRLENETGIPHDVDHIIPLRGKFVSGLHVHSNLQVVTSEFNGRKSNRFDPMQFSALVD